MTPQTKQLVEAANALISDLINKRLHFDSFQNLCKILAIFEQSIEQPEASPFKLAEIVLREYVKFKDVNGHKTVNLLPLTIVDAMVEFADRLNEVEQYTEQPEATARHQENGNTTNGEKYILDNYGERWADKYETWASGDVIDALNDFASQQTADKDQKITELTNLLSDTNKRIQEIQDEEELKDKQLQVQQSHIDDQDQLIFEQGKEIKELKEENRKLLFMIENGLGPDDLKNDITMPHEN